MKGDNWLLRAIFSEAVKLEDISFYRELLKEEISDKKIRLTIVKRMIQNSEGMKNYIYQEKIITLMTMIASEIHWHLIFAVNRRHIDEKKALVGWNEKYRTILERKLDELKEKLFDLRGKWKYGNLTTTEINDAMNMLEQSAEEVLAEIETCKTRIINDSSMDIAELT